MTQNGPLILGIESSCDETAAAVISAAGGAPRVLSSVVASQMDTHGKYGGVVPELASREHLRAIVPVVREALERAGARYETLSAVAVTEGPGLVGSLLVGITYAKAICFTHRLPLIGINHIEGHIHAVIMEARLDGHPVEFPALALVVSGGHTHLFEVAADFRYRLLGRTRDDAAGEAFDKVAKLLGFSYPGGPILDRLAPFGNPSAVSLPVSRMKGNPLDFSFSGLKTAVLRWTEQRDMTAEIDARRALLRSTPRPSIEQWLAITPQPTLNLIAAFQSTVIEELLRRLTAASADIAAQSIIVSGGVACNAGLRAAAQKRTGTGAVHQSGKEPMLAPIYFPTPNLSTDNAAMIAAAAVPRLLRRDFSSFDLKAQANLALA